ncbi:hypothetical protein [Roseateles koreensis]|uniref:YqjK-like protein n=1 Tax=Roseateles koreensis TaxID=2987526 RepID=A0ABT5KR22_9BURK|nr:hypothetical protein [Roseateles koreensis]MDC8785370.1 hypothetical protein [Roseateles koreensis]
MFKQELQNLRQQQLALRLRNIELREQIRTELAGLSQPLGWWGLAGGAVGAALLMRNMRSQGLGSPRWLAFVQLALRVVNLVRQAK